ncbi:hypothetical protein CW749_17955 [Vibrio sp. vnigr-6D03]|uniref:lipoprotein n=1 Tax=Vibrio sp. vnigr-6D03 TaxID=2058088 RepID=UPI000C3242F1|nr:lipoprotein [Vibrio sp. vnigr-6D03]PKF78096.1 hypothetical protein CW749_17955 [Vibrio sp. vnigr-6D03]
MKKYLLVLWIALLLTGCDLPFEQANQKFGRQHFISAVSAIELHKTRNGMYPSSLNELEFLGDWDQIWISSVEYKKTETGYNLYLEKSWSTTPELNFPSSFKRGLGIEKTNIQWNQN